MTNVLPASASGVWPSGSSRAESEGLEDERITTLAASPASRPCGTSCLWMGRPGTRLTGAFLRNGL